MIKSYIYISGILLLLIISCNNGIKKTDSQPSSTELHQPDDIYLEKNVQSSIDSMFIFYEHANNALQFGDTIGARIYYEKIFSVISELDEETKYVLLEWDEYNKWVKKVNSDYERIFAPDLFDQEAEEIREELTDFEEDIFGDSTGIDITTTESKPDTNLIPLQMNKRVELALKYFQTIK